MPIELITGVPGTSKTTRLVARMLEESRKPNPRPLVAMGVNGLKPGLATVIKDPTRWSEIIDRTQGPCTCPLFGGEPTHTREDGSEVFPPHTHRIPHGALVFVDEAWKWFGHLHDASRQATPRHVLDLAEHRHMGIDFVWTTQSPKQLYPFAREMVASHTHVVRKFGTRFCDTYTWGELQEDVKSEARRAAALRKTDTIPDEAWTWFQSSQEHTIKAKVPLRVFALPVMVVAVVALGWLAFSSLRPSVADAAAAEGPEAALAAPARSEDATPARREVQHRPATPAEYAALHLPRFATMPHTAPIFDGREPVTDPLLLCMAGERGVDANGQVKEPTCTCLTEQGTRYTLSDVECRTVARWGQPYNPYRRHSEPAPQHPQDVAGRVHVPAGGRDPEPVGVVGATGIQHHYGGMRAVQ